MNVPFRLLIILLLLTGLVAVVSPAAAQDGGMLVLSAPETEAFPAVRFYFDAYDSRGQFIEKLTAGDIRVYENEIEIKPDALSQVSNGLQVILAINTSPAMANASAGSTDYQRLQENLVEWTGAQPSETLDDFSLATPTGLFVIRTRKPEEITQAIEQYQPDLASMQPSINSLAEALDLATDPLGRPMLKRAILYVTPPLPPAATAALSDLTQRAVSMGVRVNIWLISPPSTLNAPNPLKDLAEATGGKFSQIAPGAPYPEIESLFAPLRQTYEGMYTSAVQKSGAHRLSVSLEQRSRQIDSNTRTFELTVQAPNPIFLSPPASVNRTWSEPAKKDEESVLAPDQVPLQIVVEFPDGHMRPLKATRLYADGVLVEENTQEPFDTFTLPIGTLETTTRQVLKVEAVDALGLVGSSIEVPVDIVIEEPAVVSLLDHVSTRGMIAVGAVVISGTALVLILTGTQQKLWGKRPKTDKRRMKDPVTQPVQIREERPSRPRKENEVPAWNPAWPRSVSQPAPARLIALDENEQPITGGVIPLGRQEITFGSDPRRATQVLTSSTVDGLHARLSRDADGNFLLSDQGSIAGTWINFAPVTASGAKVEHGDLIHIGKAMFRFELTDPTRIPTPEIQVIDLELKE